MASLPKYTSCHSGEHLLSTSSRHVARQGHLGTNTLTPKFHWDAQNGHSDKLVNVSHSTGSTAVKLSPCLVWGHMHSPTSSATSFSQEDEAPKGSGTLGGIKLAIHNGWQKYPAGAPMCAAITWLGWWGGHLQASGAPQLGCSTVPNTGGEDPLTCHITVILSFFALGQKSTIWSYPIAVPTVNDNCDGLSWRGPSPGSTIFKRGVVAATIPEVSAALLGPPGGFQRYLSVPFEPISSLCCLRYNLFLLYVFWQIALLMTDLVFGCHMVTDSLKWNQPNWDTGV